MTTLEQKAREYSNYALAQDGYITGYTEALRWRDVNEELPKECTGVLVKNYHCPCQEFYIQEAFLDIGVWQCPITGSASFFATRKLQTKLILK